MCLRVTNYPTQQNCSKLKWGKLICYYQFKILNFDITSLKLINSHFFTSQKIPVKRQTEHSGFRILPWYEQSCCSDFRRKWRYIYARRLFKNHLQLLLSWAQIIKYIYFICKQFLWFRVFKICHFGQLGTIYARNNLCYKRVEEKNTLLRGRLIRLRNCSKLV